jgi:hypothetical protein
MLPHSGTFITLLIILHLMMLRYVNMSHFIFHTLNDKFISFNATHYCILVELEKSS